MIYAIIRPLARVAIQVYFRKIYLTHTGRIPRNKPVILACNHPTAFLEPCILATTLDRPLYFLVRGDFFSRPLFARLLRLLHMLPVYRLKDGGFSKLKDNFSTFEACQRALQSNRTIMIFVEGNTKYEKRLRPLQKGAARIAFGTLERYDDLEDVFIVPVGVTYTQADRFRSDVMIDCGEPLRTRDFMAQYRENNADAIAALTQALEERLRAQVVHIEHPKDEILVEYLLEMDRTERPEPLIPVLVRKHSPLAGEIRIGAVINRLGETDLAELRRKTYTYFDQLERLGLEDRDLFTSPVLALRERLLLLLGLPLSLPGFLLNFPPLRAARLLADKNVPHIEFYSPVMVAAGIGIYLVYLLILLAAGGLSWGWWSLVLIAAVPLSGLPALWYLDRLDHWRSVQRIRSVNESQQSALREQRALIRRELEQKMQPEGSRDSGKED